MTYYFGHQNVNHSADYVFSADENGDITITFQKTGNTRVVKLEQFAEKRYNCYEAIVSRILQDYPATASVYVTDAGKDAINKQVYKNQRSQITD